VSDEHVPEPPLDRVRVVVVDDSSEMREMLRMLLDDDRFEIVGEGADGVEAIELAAALAPDLLVLDRQMPRLGGVEAIPEIRRVAPRTTVVLFTTATDTGTYHAALSAGALDVFDKTALVDFVDRLASRLLDHWAGDDAEIEVRVGPVPSAAARAWTANTRRILGAVRLRPDVLDEPVPAEVLDMFERFVQRWDEVSRADDARDEFVWTARASSSDVTRLVESWAVIDRMSDEQLAELGVQWAPPEGEPFFAALTAGVMRALEEHAATQGLARRLQRQWPPAG
jgi:CheY-like chemotaxis protein